MPCALNQGTAQLVPDGLLVVGVIRLRMLADGDLALGSYADWPITTFAAAFGTWMIWTEAWLNA